MQYHPLLNSLIEQLKVAGILDASGTGIVQTTTAPTTGSAAYQVVFNALAAGSLGSQGGFVDNGADSMITANGLELGIESYWTRAGGALGVQRLATYTDGEVAVKIAANPGSTILKWHNNPTTYKCLAMFQQGGSLKYGTQTPGNFNQLGALGLPGGDYWMAIATKMIAGTTTTATQDCVVEFRAWAGAFGSRPALPGASVTLPAADYAGIESGLVGLSLLDFASIIQQMRITV